MKSHFPSSHHSFPSSHHHPPPLLPSPLPSPPAHAPAVVFPCSNQSSEGQGTGHRPSVSCFQVGEVTQHAGRAKSRNKWGDMHTWW